MSLSDFNWRTALVLAVVLAFFIFLQKTPGFPDPDSFYHAKMAMLMKEQPIIKEFPWIKFAPFTEQFTDQHFFYHLLLTPFAAIFPPLPGIKIAAVFFALLALAAFYLFLQRSSIRHPLFFTLLLLTSAPFLFRLNLAKAGPLSLVFLLLALHFLWKKKYLLLGLTAFFYVWLHGGWSLLILLLIANLITEGLLALSKFKHQERNSVRAIFFNLRLFLKQPFNKNNRKLIMSVLAGLGLGLILNPYFPQNLQFYWEQTVQIGLLNYQGLIPVGAEWYPYSFLKLIIENILIFLLFFSVLGLLCRKIFKPQIFKPPSAFNEKLFTKMFCLFLLATIFFLLTLKSQRFVEYFVPFFVLATAFLSEIVLPPNFSFKSWLTQSSFLKKSANLFIGAFLILTVVFWLGITVFSLRQKFANSFSPNYLKQAADWLRENTPANSLIFHSSWGDFPMLFFHNSHNTYLTGLDPTFFYRSNPALYKKWSKIISAKVEKELAKEIKEDFGANFILIKNSETPLLKIIEKDNLFNLKYQDQEAKIFEIDYASATN